jgi:PIN domain nuclease of toxin-antitoxin system
MNIFLDTHVLLWWLDDNPLLSKGVRSAIASSENLVILSSVVIWEIRIKQALGKLVVTPDFYDVLKNEGFEMLSITPDHAYAVGELPMHHRDPFDRMIIAQARLEGLTIATQDAVFKQYDGVSVLGV